MADERKIRDEQDFAWLRRWRDGDTSAGSLLIRRHAPAVQRLFRSFVADAAADLTQRTFLACVQHRDALAATAPFRAYLFGVARHQLRMHLRTRGRRDDRVDPLEQSIEDQAPTPGGLIDLRAEQQLLLGALRRIPVDLQLIVQLHYWETLSIEEVAAAMEIPAGTVKSRLWRARKLLREAILASQAAPALRESTMQSFDDWARSLADALVADEPAKEPE